MANPKHRYRSLAGPGSSPNQLCQLGGSRPVRLLHPVLIDVLGNPGAGMAQPVGKNLSVHTNPQHCGCIPVPSVMKADMGKSGFSDCPCESLGDVLGYQRPADLVGKNVAVSLPETWSAVGFFFSLPGLEGPKDL